VDVQWGQPATIRIVGAMTGPHARIRRVAAATILVLAGLGVTVATGPTASAEDPQILVSDDGVNFTPSLTDGLFDGLGLLIPLESIESSLWVKNTSTVDGSLRLTVDELTTTSSVFTSNLSLTAVSGNETWTWTLDELAVCGDVIPTLPIPAGATVRIDLAVAMADVDGLTAQDESANLAFTVDVRDAQSPFPAEPCSVPGGVDNGAGGGGDLSGTGTEAFPMVALSAGLLLGGLTLLLLRRRRPHEDPA